ncbi:MAG: methyltransferase domain-containing protein [Acidimicrobiia bacterium]
MTAYDNRRYALVNRWDPSHLHKVDRLLGSLAGQHVLEVGCGAGHLTKRLAERKVDVVGIDANPQASDVSGSDLVRTMQAEDLDFDDDSFDVILSVHALEHIPALEAALVEMARVLRPGGRALFIYPAEPIMGLYAIPTSIILHGTPFRAREVHCQKLWPAKLRSMMKPLGWSETHHEFDLFKSPQFVSVFSAS